MGFGRSRREMMIGSFAAAVDAGLCGSAFARMSSRAREDAARLLLPGTRWETPYTIADSGASGPTVLVTAGIHGNERAPPRAARAIGTWKPIGGRLIVFPEVNRPALAAGTRHTPRARFPDLNRTFPTAATPEARGELGRALWQKVVEIAPDWVLDLHEGYDFNGRTRKSMGSSIVYVNDPRTQAMTLAMAERLRTAVNRTIVDPTKAFTLISPGPIASLARSVTAMLGIPALVIETTWPSQPMALRVAQHLLLVTTCLRALGVLGAE
jgi:predicted deacylase